MVKSLSTRRRPFAPNCSRRVASSTRVASRSAKSSMEPGSIKKPAASSMPRSGMAPTRVVTTGIPAAIASRTATGRPSLYDGRTNTAAEASSAWASSGPTQPGSATRPAIPKAAASARNASTSPLPAMTASHCNDAKAWRGQGPQQVGRSFSRAECAEVYDTAGAIAAVWLGHRGRERNAVGHNDHLALVDSQTLHQILPPKSADHDNSRCARHLPRQDPRKRGDLADRRRQRTRNHEGAELLAH